MTVVAADKWFADFNGSAFPHPADEHEYGSLDARVFLQDEKWVNIGGDAFYLEEMSEDYLHNVLVMLFTDAQHFQNLMLDWYESAILSFSTGFTSPTEVQRVECTSGALACADSNAHEWLYSTPLMQRLEVLLGG